MSVLDRVHVAFFNCHQFETMIYIADDIVLARMLPTLGLAFETAMYYHDEGDESDND